MEGTYEGLNKRLGVPANPAGDEEPSGNASGELAIKATSQSINKR